MKKLKWIILLILPLVALIATMQSGWAPGKAATNLIDLDIFDPTAAGTKYFVKLAIYYEDLPPNLEMCPVTDVYPDNALTKLIFFATVTKGNEIFAFSYESPEVCYSVTDAQDEILYDFADALVAHITGVSNPPFDYAVKSIGDFVDTTTSIGTGGIVLGQNLPPSGELSPGFKMVDFVLAIKE